MSMPRHLCSQCRTQIALTLFLGLMICYMIRVDINVTILSMVNDTIDEGTNNSVPQEAVCSAPQKSNKTSPKISIGTYNWSRPTQGLILGAFFWGYIVTQIPGGILSLRFGPRWVGFSSILVCSLLDLFIPTAASISPFLLIGTRVLQGLAQGIVAPTCICVIGRWTPPNERSRTTAFVTSGMPVGTVAGLALAGVLSQPRSSWDGASLVSHWNVTHYLFGGLGILFVILWCNIVYDTPETHPRIRNEELALIQCELMGVSVPSSRKETKREVSCDRNETTNEIQPTSQSDKRQKLLRGSANQPPVPWTNVLRCRHVWSILVCGLTFNWSWYTLITCMPTYMSRVLGFSMADNGILSSVPYLVQCAFAQLVGFTSDELIKHGKLSTTWVRKLNNCIALGGIGVGLILVGYIGCSRIAAVAIFATTIGLMGAANSGYPANAVDLAPHFSGVIISFTNCVATLPGIFGPMLVGYVTKDSSSLDNWRIIYGVSAGLAWFGAVFNLFMTSGQKQYWADSSATI